MRSGVIFQFHVRCDCLLFSLSQLYLVILQLFVLSSSDRWAVTHRLSVSRCVHLEDIKFSPPQKNVCERAQKSTTTTKQTWTITTHSFHSHQLDLARTLCVEIENSSLEPNMQTSPLTGWNVRNLRTFSMPCHHTDYFIRHSLITLMRLF